MINTILMVSSAKIFILMAGILEKLRKKPENQIAEDDHPERPDLTEKEADEAFKEIYEKFKSRKLKKKKAS